MPETTLKKNKSRKAQVDPNEFRDHLATVDEQGKRKWIYATKPSGKLFNIRKALSYFYFIAFFGLPFIQVNGRPFLMFNVPETKFILFGKVFWPQDFFIFGLIMVTAVLFIVLFTAAFGRLFCGWACPQTIFMEMLFRRIEFAILGNANQQRMLKKAPWSTEKMIKVSAKHIAFFALSFVIGNFFLAYIIGMPALVEIIKGPVTEHLGGLSAMLIFSGVFYGVYSYFREQVCTVVCPYGRLQSVLLDKNSMIVAYDYKRGEPRGNFKAAAPGAELGDCIDCFKCVTVCPTGIDIRNGVQMECVGCTACIDACNEVMDKIGKPRGLIRYASENAIAEGKPLRFTGRMKLYTGLCLTFVILISALLYTRKDIGATIIRTPGMLYQERGADSISNLYNIKLVNKTVSNIPLEIKLEAMNGEIQIIGGSHINIAKEGQGAGSFFVILPREKIHKRKTEIDLGLYAEGKRISVITTNFLGPVN